MRACPAGLPVKAHALVASAGFQHPALAVAPRIKGATEGQHRTRINFYSTGLRYRGCDHQGVTGRIRQAAGHECVAGACGRGDHRPRFGAGMELVQCRLRRMGLRADGRHQAGGQAIGGDAIMVHREAEQGHLRCRPPYWVLGERHGVDREGGASRAPLCLRSPRRLWRSCRPSRPGAVGVLCRANLRVARCEADFAEPDQIDRGGCCDP